MQLVHREAANLWPDREIFLLSIGTGSAPGTAFKGNIKKIVDGMKEILTATERVPETFTKATPS